MKDWIINYLSDRKQFAEFDNNNNGRMAVDNIKSETCYIECGVPQGYILGPLLYLIYVNDITNSTKASLLSFANDTSLIISDIN